MIEYIYFVKCPGCEDEPFEFFDEAKDFALSCLTQQPIITQIEVSRNDFGECIDSCDLGTVWSWEEVMKDTEAESEASVFTKDDLKKFNPDCDPEFDALDNSLEETFEIEPDYVGSTIDSLNSYCPGLGDACLGLADGDGCSYKGYDVEFIDGEYCVYLNESTSGLNECRKPIPEGMTIEELVEAMEENEDTVECTWCNDLFNKDQCRYEVNLGWLCSRCADAIKSRGETLTFKENNYWDFLDEEVDSVTEALNLDEPVDFEYRNEEVTLQGRRYDVDDWEEEDVKVNFTYTKNKADVAMDIWDNFITEEDATDVPGGLVTLEDDAEWGKYLETHWDTLLDKYYDQLLDLYREEATLDFVENHDLNDYKESFNVKSMLEELEEPDSYRARLVACPECGAEKSFDHETGICIECGFNI